MQLHAPEIDRRIVVLDDDADSRELFTMVLRMSGFRVDDFEAGEDALAAIGTDTPAVMVMDLNLANGIDGYEAARRVRALHSAETVRLVATTGLSAAAVREECSLFDAILTKPVDSDELVAVVKRLTSPPL